MRHAFARQMHQLRQARITAGSLPSGAAQAQLSALSPAAGLCYYVRQHMALTERAAQPVAPLCLAA